jgi:hypothetical protein
VKARAGKDARPGNALYLLFPITKFTVLGWFAFTVTDFSHVFGSVNNGRCTARSVRTS